MNKYSHINGELQRQASGGAREPRKERRENEAERETGEKDRSSKPKKQGQSREKDQKKIILAIAADP